jgi:hypothetical protein
MKISVGLYGTNAHQIALAMIQGFNKHYTLFRQTSREAKTRFEQADWLGVHKAVKERIRFYDDRVDECVERLRNEFDASNIDYADLAAGQAALYRPVAQPQAAGTGRNLLQFGDDQDPAPELFPQRFHFRPPDHVDRKHRRRRQPDLPQLLRQGRRPARRRAQDRRGFRLAPSLCRPGTRCRITSTTRFAAS